MGNRSSLMLQDEEIKQISKETGFSHLQIEKLFSRFAHLDRNNCGTLTKDDLLSIPELAINPLCDRLIQMFFADCDPTDERINFKQFMRTLATFRASNHSTSNGINNNSNHHRASQSDANAPRLTLPRVASSHNVIQSRLSQQNIMRHYGASRNIPHLRKSESFLAGFNNIPHQQVGVNFLSNPLHLAAAISFGGFGSKIEFIFRIYDVDNDGRIGPKDLKCILKMMVGNYIEDVQLDKIATRVFNELDQDSDGFIDYEEFCKVFNGRDLDDKLRVKFF